MVRNPFFLGLVVLVTVGFQVLASYWSYLSFMEGELAIGFSFFLFVPALALLLAFYLLWFRRQRKGQKP